MLNDEPIIGNQPKPAIDTNPVTPIGGPANVN